MVFGARWGYNFNSSETGTGRGPGSQVKVESIHANDAYVEVRLAGRFELPKLEMLIDDIAAFMVEKAARALLLDGLTMTGKPPNFMDRYQVGLALQRLPKGVRVATLVRAEWIDPEQFGLRVAQNRGVDGNIFSDRDQALAWLLDPSEKPAPPAPPTSPR